ncbi:MAG: ATP-binding protein [Clostridia bacterium]|nr:ATP-binding protein [Clostridia bacterium]
MRNAIFKNIFVTAMAVFVISVICIVAALYGSFSAQQKQNLENEALYLSAAVNGHGPAFLGSVPATDGTRVTYIAADGTVLFDSAADPASLENHALRDEVKQALESGTGYSSRYSQTSGRRTANYAVRLEDGTVLRVSNTLYTRAMLAINLFTPLLLVLVLAMALSFASAAGMSRRITEPLGAIDLRDPDDRGVYEELRPLVQRIRAQNREIQHNMEELKAEHARQDEMRREFTANVSHELKTPLTSISGYAELIQGGMVRQEDVPRFAGTIWREAQRLIVLVNDIIRLSRLDDKDVEEEREPVELSALCREVIESLAPAAAEKDVSFALTGTPATVTGIRQILGEVIYNLCDNAIKYNRPGGSVAVDVQETDGQTVLSVKDTGIGIPEEELGRVFERFYRVDKSHSKEVGGTGLGLSIVKHGAAYHNAAVEVESTPGEGTCFTVRFPREPLIIRHQPAARSAEKEE